MGRSFKALALVERWATGRWLIYAGLARACKRVLLNRREVDGEVESRSRLSARFATGKRGRRFGPFESKKIPGQERGSRHTFLRYSCGLVAVGAIVACAAPVDLSAVQKYASTTAAAGTSFSALAADFTASCLRGNAALDGLVYATNSRSVPTIVGILSTAQLTDAATIVPTLDPGYTYVAPSPGPTTPPLSAPAILPRQATCDDAADVSKSWDKANATVLAYVQSLGNLADVDAIPTPNPAPLASPLEEVGVSSAAVQAGSNLLTEIASFYYRNKSDRYIREFLAQVNPSMPGAMETLEVVNAAYSLELASEFTFIAARYPVSQGIN